MAHEPSAVLDFGNMSVHWIGANSDGVIEYIPRKKPYFGTNS